MRSALRAWLSYVCADAATLAYRAAHVLWTPSLLDGFLLHAGPPQRELRGLEFLAGWMQHQPFSATIQRIEEEFA